MHVSAGVVLVDAFDFISFGSIVVISVGAVLSRLAYFRLWMPCLSYCPFAASVGRSSPTKSCRVF